MSLNDELSEIRRIIGGEHYKRLEQRATLAYDAFNKQAKHQRPRGGNHDPHTSRSKTIGGLIVALYSVETAGHSAVIELKPAYCSPPREVSSEEAPLTIINEFGN